MGPRERGARDPRVMDRVAYNALAVPALWLGAHAAQLWDAKLRRGLRERRGLTQRLTSHREELSGCVWFHASSAGEYEQARPILRGLRERAPELPTLTTSFSPSGHDQATKHPEAHYAEYLPLDTPSAAPPLLRALSPAAFVFVSFDCWPNWVWSIRRAGIPLLLLNAHFDENSVRSAWYARDFFASLFNCFDCIASVHEADRERFRDIGVTTRLEVTGDSRVDQILQRYELSAQGPVQDALARQAHRYVTLGSVWPQDLRVILEPILDVVAASPALGLIVAPHEPHDELLRELESRLATRGLNAVRLSNWMQATDEDGRIILVDTVGQLAEIYCATILSYVGGGFSTGVHNVLEPAVTGQPVLFGPRHANAHEARQLIRLDAARAVSNSDEMTAALRHWLSDESARAAAAERAADFVRAQAGASTRAVELLGHYVKSA